MSVGTSPFMWTGVTMKLKKLLDAYIDSKPECTEVPVYPIAYSLLLNSISKDKRRDHASDLKYRGRRLVMRK